MKRFLFFIILIVSKVVLAFGAPTILPSADRSMSYSIVTKLDKKKAFQKVSIWAARTFVDANETIKLRDADMGVLVAKGTIACSALKLGSGYGQNQKAKFTLEISTSNKKVEIKMTDIIATDDGSYDSDSRPSKKEELESLSKECLVPYVDLIKKELV